MIARDVTTKYTENGKQNEATKAIKSSTPQKDSRDYYYATLQKFAGLPIIYYNNYQLPTTHLRSNILIKPKNCWTVNISENMINRFPFLLKC